MVPKSIYNVWWGGGFLRKIIQKLLLLKNYAIPHGHANALPGPHLVMGFEAQNYIPFMVNLP